MPFFDTFVDDKGATVSADGLYRYEWWKGWDTTRPPLLFVCLNPSKADAVVEDPTSNRIVDFAQFFRFGSARICNLYAFRATKPHELINAEDPVGPENDAYLRSNLLAVHNAGGKVCAAWGNGTRWPRGRKPSVRFRDAYFLELASDAGVPLYRLDELTDKGNPRHPLYVARNTSKLELWHT